MGYRILIADDSSTIQKVIKIALSPYAIDIVCANSMEEATKEVGTLNFDILVIDANLLGTKGPNDIKKLAEANKNKPVLLLAGTYESVNEEEFKRLDLTNFLKKPFESTDIVKKISSLLGHDLAKIGSEEKNVAKISLQEPSGEFNLETEDDEKEKFDVNAPSIFKIALGTSAFNDFGAENQEKTEGEITDLPVFSVDKNMKGKKAFENDVDVSLPPPPPIVPFKINDAPLDVTLTEEYGKIESKPSFVEKKADKFAPKITEEEIALPSLADLSQDKKGHIPNLKIDFSSSPSFTYGENKTDKSKNLKIDLGQEGLPSLEIKGTVSSMLREELAAMVKEAVETYCQRHFNELAKEIILEELRRLADEKARFLTE